MLLGASLLFFLAGADRGWAVALPGLYEARVPVADQSLQVRDQALQQALTMVLVRLTGSRVLPGSAPAQPIVARASSLVQGYGYEAPETGTGLLLHAQFDPRAVEAALRAQGLPVWGDNRLSHLTWIALRDGGTRTLLNAAGVANRAPALVSTADARGLVLTFPQVDAPDRRALTFEDVWAGNYDAIRAASRRYNPDQYLAARVQPENGRWSAHWALLGPGGMQDEWDTNADSLDAALAEGVNQLADREAQRFAVAAGQSAQGLLLAVAGVETLKDYGHTLNYLRALNPVRSVQVVSVENGTMTFRLAIDGTPETLTRVIAAGRVLQPETQGVFSSTMNYSLVR